MQPQAVHRCEERQQRTGLIRLNKHASDKQTHASSPSNHLCPQVLNYAGVAPPTPAEVCAAAARTVNFIDLGGHPAFLKTTVFGLTSMLPGGWAGCVVGPMAALVFVFIHCVKRR
jgi:hypothetical protein